MSSDKYQSGEAYRDDRAQSSTSSFLSDPAKVAADILKDYAGARSEASLQEIIGLVQSLRNEGTPADDRKGYAVQITRKLRSSLIYKQQH
jgi:hypothetical protein